jgi:hypothetical protein
VTAPRQPAAAPVTIAALKPGAPLRLTKASATRAPRSLNDLFAEIGGDH